MSEQGVEIRGCKATKSIFKKAVLASDADWYEEYLKPIISVKIVDNIDKAINHIEKYGFAKSANKFSISNTSLDGGKLGWTNSNSLSKSVYESIIKIDVGEYTLITSGNNILFLKLNSKRYKENLNNLETEKLKNSIINKQKTDLLNLYSNTQLSLKKNNTLIEIK